MINNILINKQYLKENYFYLICINKVLNKIYVVTDVYRHTAKELRTDVLNHIEQSFYCFNCCEKKPKDFKNLDIQFITLIDLIKINKDVGNTELC